MSRQVQRHQFQPDNVADCDWFLQAIATIAVALVLDRQSRVFKGVENARQAINAMNFLNSAAVQSKENVIAFDTLWPEHEESRGAPSCSRVRFCLARIFAAYFLADEKGLIDRSYATQALELQLAVLLKEDLAFWLAT
jgi:hypothetical protein